MPNDRIFAFSRGIENNLAKSIEENPKDRKLNNFLSSGTMAKFKKSLFRKEFNEFFFNSV